MLPLGWIFRLELFGKSGKVPLNPLKSLKQFCRGVVAATKYREPRLCRPQVLVQLLAASALRRKPIGRKEVFVHLFEWSWEEGGLGVHFWRTCWAPLKQLGPPLVPFLTPFLVGRHPLLKQTTTEKRVPLFQPLYWRT